MTRGWLNLLALATGAGLLLAVLFPTGVLGQEEDIEAAIGQSRSGATMRELQAQTSANPPKTNDLHDLAVFYHKRGMANHRLGNYSRAIEDLRRALENNQPDSSMPDGWGERWRIQWNLGQAIAQRGAQFEAIEHWKAMSREYQQRDWFLYHNAQLNLASAYIFLAQFREADAVLQEANNTLPYLRGLREPWARFGAGRLMHNASVNAQFLEQQGRHAEAERRRRSALDDAQKSIENLSRAFPQDHLFVRNAVRGIGGQKVTLASNLATQGKYGEAELFARSGLEDRLAAFGINTTQVSHALEVLGWTRFQQGDIATAERYYRHAAASLLGSGVALYSTRLAGRRAALGNAMIAQGRWPEALKVFEERDQGLRSDTEQFKTFGSRHVSWALALHKTGQSQRAAVMAERMVAGQLKRPVLNRWYIAQLRGVLGIALAASGKTTEALRAFRDAIPELMRRDQDIASAEDIGYWRAFWQRVILEGYLDVLAKMYTTAEVSPNLDLVDESFRIADVARGSSVQEAITATAARAELPDRNLAELARKEQDTLNRVVALNQLLARLAAAPHQERLNKVIADMRAEIERLRQEHAALRADIRRRYPEYAELIDPRPAGIAEVRKALARGEALVSIYLGESRSYVWTIGAGGKAAFRVVPVKREEVESDVRELRRAVDLGDASPARLRPFDLGRAHKLYRAFFEPDEALWKEAQVLNVIPHGALGQLPLGLLVTAVSPAGDPLSYRDAAWLIRKVAIAQLPSAAALTALRRAPAGKGGRQPFIGFGDPLFAAETGTGGREGVVRNLVIRKVADRTEDQIIAVMRGGRTEQQVSTPMPTLSRAFALLSALPDTSDELKEIAAALKGDPARDVFVNRQATEKNVKQTGLDNRRVVAFATHGIAPGQLTGLDQPALALSNPALTADTDNDGFLTMEEVLGLKLDADWVVLSACNTASADGKGSEAVSGLGRAFFYAGARSLLVSNWAVETTSARLLTTELFRRQAENPSLTRAEALRQSMLSLMGKNATDATGRATFSYAHPAFWAPFSLVGDGGR